MSSSMLLIVEVSEGTLGNKRQLERINHVDLVTRTISALRKDLLLMFTALPTACPRSNSPHRP